MLKTNLQEQITIHALPSKVWKVLTNPEYTRQYLSNFQQEDDWLEGGTIHVANDPSLVRPLEGHVLESVPGIRLRYAVHEQKDRPLVLTSYELIVASEGIELKLKCEGFHDSDEDYHRRIQATRFILEQVKRLAENG